MPHLTPPFRRERIATGIGAGAILAGCLLVAAAGPRTPQAERPSRRTRACATEACHTSLVRGASVHAPAARNECTGCHAYADVDRHLFRLTTPPDQLCGSCHTLRLDRIVHAPLTGGDCTSCHDPHRSDQPALLLGDGSRGLCVTCHQEAYDAREHVHGPVAVGACLVCHDAHSSGHEGLLTAGPEQLCLDCHAEIQPTGAEARHRHKPMDDGCSSCHDPHASDFEFQLRAANPGLCLSCHEGVSAAVQSAAVVHGPVMAEGGCVTCHQPHYSSLPRLQRFEQPQLCLDCHDETIRTADGREIEDMATLLEENENHHGPIRNGACTACHDPHAANEFRLLFQSYPLEFYAPFEAERYALCFSCHVADLVLDESGTGLTGFRDGDRNLHWLHVNRQKGRSCRACHEVHASNRPFHMRESVPFGASGWLLEINFEKTDDGGSCEPGCHKLQKYRRTAPPAAGPSGPVPAEGGTP
jgi:predicted CXXCH cytochrome family protein